MNKYPTVSVITRKIVNWTVPPEVQNILRRMRLGLISEFSERGLKSEFARNQKFYNIHKGERCFILCTGPSINKQNLKSLKGEVCIAISQFYLHRDIRIINPLYHVVAPNHPPFRFELIRKDFEGLNKYYSSHTIYFFGHINYDYSVFNFLKQNPKFRNDNIHHLNYSRLIQLDESNFQNPSLWDISKLLFRPRTALYCAIQFASYMGFKSIYLLGCDHDYLSSLNNRKSTVHFYEDGKGIDDSSVWPSTERHLLEYYRLWAEYRLMRSYLEPRGCCIYNATEGGMLDAFPRVTLSEALEGRHEKGAQRRLTYE